MKRVVKIKTMKGEDRFEYCSSLNRKKWICVMVEPYDSGYGWSFHHFLNDDGQFNGGKFFETREEIRQLIRKLNRESEDVVYVGGLH